MHASTESWPGRIALMLAHCAGMVDLVALPVWVGALIAQYGFTPPQAGGLATLFLVGAVLSSLFFAPRFNHIDSRTAAIAGFGTACLAFLGAAFVADFAALAALQFVAGVSVGCALSFTHGTIARSANPHRLFAIVGMALGVFAIVFLGVTPNLIAAFGGPALFRTFAVIMVVAAIAAFISFPTATTRGDEDLIDEVTRLRPAVWFGVAGISCMALTQAMMFSFLERIGIERGFGREAVTGVLIGLGFVNLFPAPLAAFLENRVSQRAVLFVGPICQALIALAISFSGGFFAYAAPAVFFAAVMIFTHTFAFGLLARLDPTARALAGTPAMLMIGAAIGPILGGVFVQGFGYGSLGAAAVIIAAVAIFLFSNVHAPDTGILDARTARKAA
jgi:predicted MFS family arabinose efflux permease